MKAMRAMIVGDRSGQRSEVRSSARKRRLLLAAASALFALGVNGEAGAAPCAGFTDVEDTSPFCVNVEWLRNRGVTLGCSATTYCPGDPVTRLQMAVFMNRLANSLFPLTCAAGQVMKWDGAAWTCSNDLTGGSGGGGTVTSVLAGTGLQGTPNPITGAGSLNVAPAYQLPQGCANGQVPKSNGGGGWTCAADATGGSGTVTSLGQGTGITLSSNPITTTGSVAVNTAVIQARVTGTCVAGSSIRAIDAAGNVTCETDDAGPANAFVQGGNAFGTIATLGTTDNQPLQLRANNITALRVWGDPLAVNGTATIIGGSLANSFAPGVHGATIAGGGTDAGDADPTVGGNEGPNIVTGSYGTIGGGAGNTAGLPGGAGGPALRPYATVGGGNRNVASGTYSTVAGGWGNAALGFESAIGGGGGNVAAGQASLVAGGDGNCAGGDFSFAGGVGASVRPGNGTPSLCFAFIGDSGDANGDEGTFVWADSQPQLLVSTGPNQFVVRAQGGVGVNRPPLMDLIELSVFARAGGPNSFANLYLGPNDPDFGGILLSGGGSTAGSNNAVFAIDHYRNLNGDEGQVRRLLIDAVGRVALNRDDGLPGGQARPFSVGTDGTNGNGAHLTAGGAWTNGSSREFKEDFEPVDGGEVLRRVVALPIQTWRYRGSEEGRHIGPMAEDFAQSFGLGAGDRYIATVDADGVALAAIQGLNAKLAAALAERDRLVADHARELAALRERVARAEALALDVAALKAMLATMSAGRTAATAR